MLLWLASRSRPLVDASERTLYERFITSTFGRRGATVRRCLRARLTAPQIHRLAHSLRFDVDAAPSALTFDQWLAIYRFWSWHARA